MRHMLKTVSSKQQPYIQYSSIGMHVADSMWEHMLYEPVIATVVLDPIELIRIRK